MVRIAYHDHGARVVAYVLVSGKVAAKADGRNAVAAIADAVARFRTTRTLRRDLSPGGKGAMLFGRWCTP